MGMVICRYYSRVSQKW